MSIHRISSNIWLVYFFQILLLRKRASAYFWVLRICIHFFMVTDLRTEWHTQFRKTLIFYDFLIGKVGGHLVFGLMRHSGGGGFVIEYEGLKSYSENC